jgi:hypothetical protein
MLGDQRSRTAPRVPEGRASVRRMGRPRVRPHLVQPGMKSKRVRRLGPAFVGSWALAKGCSTLRQSRHAP